ncbi:ankyrin repeat domain-containing protein [Holosporaceae bacterium 'Namur']|nr:ankyrin repeat domain-containing protein [Holosporaceae bacterium 'Namur']
MNSKDINVRTDEIQTTSMEAKEFDESLLHMLNNLTEDPIEAEELKELNDSFLTPFIMNRLLTLQVSLGIFQEEITELMKEGVSQNSSVRGKLLHAYKAIVNHELELVQDASPEQVSLLRLSQMVAYLARPYIVEVMQESIKKLLNPNEVELDINLLREAINHARASNSLAGEYLDLTNDKIIKRIRAGKLAVIQLHDLTRDGEIISAPKTLVLPPEQVDKEIARHKEKLGFITGFSGDKITQEYFPAKAEMAECLSLAFRNNDLSFIKLCLDNKKLSKGVLEGHMDLFYQTFEKGRFDLLDIMVEHELFGFGTNEIAHIDKRLPSGLTPLMEACKKGDSILARKLIAMGADTTLTDKDGYNALMYAALYTNEQINELNKSSEEQSEAIKDLKLAKNSIITALLKDKRLDLNAKNKADGKTAMQILLEHSVIKNEQGITELRGDHGAIEKLIAAGADPSFGKFELSFKAKFFITVGISVALTAVKNAVINYIGLGIIGRTIFYPVIRVVDYALDVVIAYKAYLDAKNPLYVLSRTILDTEYANDTLINMDKKPMIGAFHINWYGKVIAGDDLKNYMTNHVGYRNIKNAFFTTESIPTTSGNPSELRLSKEAQLIMAETLFNRYYRLKQDLGNHWLAPWTRKALENLSEEIKQAYIKTNYGYKINSTSLEKLTAIFIPSNHRKLVEEIFASGEKRELFYKFHSLVKLGALSVDLETRYNLEKFEQLLHSPERSKQIEIEKNHTDQKISFDDFIEFCHSLTIEGVDLDTTFRIVEHEFKKGLESDYEPKTLFELISGASADIMHAVLDGGVKGIAYAAGSSRSKVHHYLAEGISTLGAMGNSALHVGIREFYDSIYSLPAVALAGGAYALYKWPSQSWEVCKFVFNATCSLAVMAYSVISYALYGIKEALNLTLEGMYIIKEFALNYFADNEKSLKAPEANKEDTLALTGKVEKNTFGNIQGNQYATIL